MATIVGVRSRKSPTRSRDRISELPQNVIELILESMPIQDAVRTSALSNNWRFNWTTISKLVFDMSFYIYLIKKKLHGRDSIRFIISNILLLHNAPLVTFHLYVPYAPWDDVGNFLICLSRKGIKKLTLLNGAYTTQDMPPLLPSHIYSCAELTHLEISCCNFKLPSSNFRGFPNLISLKLHQFRFEKKSFENFITGCTLLESMTLVFGIHGEDHLIICSQSLKRLSVTGRHQPISLDAEGLQTLSMYRDMYFECDPCTQASWNMILGKVPKIENLSLPSKYLASRVGPKELPAPLNYLKVINFRSICFGSALEINSVLCLIRSAPVLEELVISSGHRREITDVVDAVSSSLGDGINLNCLKIVKFISIRGLRSELEMIESILASSPSLQKIFIVGDRGVDGKHGKKISTELMRFIRVSPKAEMIYSEQYDYMVDT